MKARAHRNCLVAVALSGAMAIPVHAMDGAGVIRACYALETTPPAQKYFDCVSREAVRLEASGADPAEVAEAATVTPRCVGPQDTLRQATSLCGTYIASAPAGILPPWTSPDVEKLAQAHALSAILNKRLPAVAQQRLPN